MTTTTTTTNPAAAAAATEVAATVAANKKAATAKATLAKEPEFVAVLYHSDRRSKSNGIKLNNNPIRFPVPEGGMPDVSSLTAEQIEKLKLNPGALKLKAMKGVFLVPGANLISLADYQAACQHPQWAEKQKQGVIEVLEWNIAAGGSATGTSLDFNPETAFRFITDSSDIEWLKRCLIKDDRAEVQSWLTERLGELEQKLSSNQQ